MKNTIFTTFALVSTLSACSDFESAQNHVNPALSPTVEQSSDYAFISVDNEDENSVSLEENAYVMDLEELGLEVYEIDSREKAEANPQWAGYDNKISISHLKDLDYDNNQLWHELLSQERLTVGYVGAAPENMLILSEDVGHKVFAFQESQDAMYESEMVKWILEAVEEEVDYIYIPVSQKDAPDMVLKAVDYAGASEIRIFDRFGTQF